MGSGQLAELAAEIGLLFWGQVLVPEKYDQVMRERGPEHSKTFTVEVSIGREFTAQADGRTKKIAAQRAARNAYGQIRQAAETSR